MPIRLSHDRSLLRIDFTGIVTNEEFATMVTTLHQVEFSGPMVPHRLSDLSQCAELDIKFPAILALAQLRKAMKFSNPFKSAIVATSPVQQGMARMFAALNDHPQITIRIFSDLESARRWIDETATPA